MVVGWASKTETRERRWTHRVGPSRRIATSHEREKSVTAVESVSSRKRRLHGLRTWIGLRFAMTGTLGSLALRQKDTQSQMKMNKLSFGAPSRQWTSGRVR